ncbi:acyl-CoA dehydrogenase [Bacteriovoracaceae bacterium]|nr:acyl-CoA dehydrogenase [Bacteriovoracaceae bacterium]
MATYRSDLQDIYFNLLDVLNITQFKEYGLEAEDIKSILEQFDKFVSGEIFPTRQKSDEEGVQLINGKVTAPECLKPMHKSFYENGWFGVGMPEDIGGTPVPEAIYTCNTSLSTSANCAWVMYPALSRAAANVIRLVGDDKMKQTYLPPMMEGKWGGTMCLTEADAGSDVGNLRTTAIPTDDGRYKIKGVKIFISGGESDLYENNIHLVLGRTPDGEAGSKGISLFIVPRFNINEDGSNGEANDVVCTKIEHKMGIHASATCELTFGTNDNCYGYLIGKEFDGMATMFIMMNEARLYCGVQGESQANLAYEFALQYAKERSQFSTEIANHPDVQKMLLKMRSVTRGMRSLCLYVATLFDHAKTDPELEQIIGLLTPIAKAYCSDQGFNMSVEAVQVHGGYGYCTEYGVEQFVRDTKIATIYEGTNGIQAIDFIMRKVLKDQGKAITKLLGMIQESMKSAEGLGFENEIDIFNNVLGKTQAILKLIQEKAVAKEFNKILFFATDFLHYSSQLVVAFRHLENAKIAKGKIENSSNQDEKDYLESKIIDFKFYVGQFLQQNISLGDSIINNEQQFSSLKF